MAANGVRGTLLLALFGWAFQDRVTRAVIVIAVMLVQIGHTVSAEPAHHWAFVPPRRPLLPAVGDPSWPANAIDCFILAQLESQGLRPSPRTTERRCSVESRST